MSRKNIEEAKKTGIQPEAGVSAHLPARGVAEKRFCRKRVAAKTFGAQGGRTAAASFGARRMVTAPPPTAYKIGTARQLPGGGSFPAVPGAGTNPL
jgi:hypothetical protein